MQAAYHTEALGSGPTYFSHAHLVPRPPAGSGYPFGYHAPNYGDGSNAPHLFLPTGYSGVTPGPFPSIGADAAAAAAVQPQAYARPGFNYASPFTAALATPLLNAVQSSLISASSNAASEMQPLQASPAQPPGLWVPENASSSSDNGAQQPYAVLPTAVLPPPQQQPQQQQDLGGPSLGSSAMGMPGLPAALASSGYGAAVDVWKHLAMVAATATGGPQGAAQLQMQGPYGTDYQLPYVQQQQQQAATAALQMQAAYLQQQQQQQQPQQQQEPAYATACQAIASLGAAAAAASLGAAQGPAGHGLTLGAASAPTHVLQLIQQQQQQQQHKLQQQQMQAAVTPDSLSDPALAAAAATALHLLQLPAGLRALAACGMMPHLLQPQQPQPTQPQALQLPICTAASGGCYSPGILAALLPPLASSSYTPSAPSGQVMGAPQPTPAALLILGLQQQQQPPQQQQQQLCPFPLGGESPMLRPPAELQVRASPRKSRLPAVQPGLPPGPQLLHFAGVPLQLPLPHAVLQAAACHPVQPASSCPPGAAKSRAAGGAVTAACTSTSAPVGGLETRRRTQADRRERRKESNRESARRCRLRREKDTCELSRRVAAQETINSNMASQLQRLEQATNVLLDQNHVLEAWLKHIQEAGDGASAAASTILGYVRNLDEQMAAAAAAVQLQAVASQGSYLPADSMAMVQIQPHPQSGASAGEAQGLQQHHLGWTSEGAAVASGAGAAGGVIDRFRSMRGGAVGGGGTDAGPLGLGGVLGVASRSSGMVDIEEETDNTEDEEQLSDGDDDGVVDLEEQL
ncbi:hypothetical protein VOLCADRAFT_92771 [Volvox carteri f. nagariensis]|uniref:BZIP domain-containing protein n=1 Tax=Volvox carteri f. nagariensis TaxID=3068 RepID=D8U0X4_VOLCA|nr:uncharacterized protein VOLCADRAFT_92771 [Volvox carteri f. nagariensis]EFJ46625.1 hypothetical protein VOLCADRAFT_92771 [Volvox carteri f. nagariensis]|eukprot:XP_002952154.1 hypothetical protein VOLCADRAFT_92771 [Volvox carteri f. nagariensis]